MNWLQRLAAALRTQPGDPVARVAELELELREKDRRLGQLIAEVEAGRKAAVGEADAAAADRMGRLLKRLAPLLGQADAMRHFAAGGQSVRAEDALMLLAKVEKALAEEGVERIGAAGETAVFDGAIHQRLSGGDVREGSRVEVRFPGYRQGARILSKALVSRKE
jgi:molecular chaperone GrpE (heat shock protein)